jgi:trans-aconitate 2-methyltransferase
MSESAHYTFGDSDVAAQRLVLLAAAFEPSSRAWLSSLALQRPACAVDLGCGPGLTTALLAQTLAPASLLGLDQSERLLARARAAAGQDTRFVAHDLSSAAPLPIPPADVLYARFLLTHLPSPGEVLRRWLAALAPGGVLLLEEVAELHSADPIMARYYERVAELQAHYGQATYIGRELPALCAAAGGSVASARSEPIQLPAATMARLHALNIQTWGQDAYALATWRHAELAALAAGLERIAAGAAAPPVVCQMAQLQVRQARHHS